MTVQRKKSQKKVKRSVRASSKKRLQYKKPRVLVLGVTGMLGSMVFHYLAEKGEVIAAGTARIPKTVTTVRGDIFPFDADTPESLEMLCAAWQPDFVINCIGIIKPYCKDTDPEGISRALRVNALFPHTLIRIGEQYNFRIIQIATDCVYSGVKGMYVEQDPHDPFDVYGKTKSLGEVRQGPILHIRTSIIGPEVKGKLSLLEWFLSQPEGSTLKGFAHHRWNGVTTLQFAELVERIICAGFSFFDTLVSTSYVHHFVPNTAVDKHELMQLFKIVFKKDVGIERVDNIGPAVDRTLATSYHVLPVAGTGPLQAALQKLSRYQNVHGPLVLW